MVKYKWIQKTVRWGPTQLWNSLGFFFVVAHLKRRLMGELIVYQSLRCPSIYQHFQESPLKLLGQLNSNFIWRLLRTQERNFVQMVLVWNPNFRKCQNFGLPYIILARSFNTCFGYVNVSGLQSRWVYKKLGLRKSSKWPQFKMGDKILNYIELNENHTYLGFNGI